MNDTPDWVKIRTEMKEMREWMQIRTELKDILAVVESLSEEQKRVVGTRVDSLQRCLSDLRLPCVFQRLYDLSCHAQTISYIMIVFHLVTTHV